MQFQTKYYKYKHMYKYTAIQKFLYTENCNVFIQLKCSSIQKQLLNTSTLYETHSYTEDSVQIIYTVFIQLICSSKATTYFKHTDEVHFSTEVSVHRKQGFHSIEMQFYIHNL